MQNLLHIFLNKLKSEKFSESSIRNYKSDIQQFINWLIENGHTDTAMMESYFETYKKVLNKAFKKTTYKRKVSSLSTFLDFAFPKDTSVIKTTHSVMKYRSALMLGAYTIVLTTVLVAVPLLVDSHPSSVEDTITLSKVKTSSDTINSISADGVKIALAAPDDSEIRDKTAFYVKGISTDEHVSVTTAEQSSGKAVIKEGSRSVQIYSDSITDSSIVLVTPTTNTYGQQLFVRHQSDGYVEISIDSTAEIDITFNWLVVNTEVYQNIL